MRAQQFFCIVVFSFALFAGPLAWAQEGAFKNPPPQEPIPEGYKTYALFLVCNATWLRENEHDGNNLYYRFVGFQRTIGEHNKAFWFWKDRVSGTSMSNVDVERAVRFCQGYGLKPSESPHILITVGYPAERPNDKSYMAVALGGLSSASTRSLIGVLEDQFVRAALKQEEIDSQRFWLNLQEVFFNALATVRGLFPTVLVDRIEVDAKAGAFSFKISGTKQ